MLNNFSIIFLGLLLVSIRKSRSNVFFSREVTNQLKGFSILAIIFSHIGYFLSPDPRFLYPYSILAGVGVNLFLFLSGFGLSLSHQKYPLSPLVFYKKRLSKLFIPMWTVVTIFLIADFFLLHRGYSVTEMWRSFLGFYPRADLSQNLDSPLWYFSVIFFLYLIFPLTFLKKLPLLSPILVLLVSLLVLKLPLPIDPDVLKLYNLHFLAFPLGMLFAQLIPAFRFKLNFVLKSVIFVMALLVFFYTAVHSGVGERPIIEQGISLITMLSILVIFILSKFDIKLFSLFGVYSYEIYLLHWPILARYNLFLGLPSFLMVIFNLSLILILGYLLQKSVKYLTL